MKKKHLLVAVVLLALLVAAIVPVLAGLPGDNISIDIKPGSYPNSVKLGSQGVIPIAILSHEIGEVWTSDFDATAVNPDTVVLDGSAKVAVRGNGNKFLAHQEDVNGDGLMDLVVQVETENYIPGSIQEGYATLRAETYDEEVVIGSDEITIIPM